MITQLHQITAQVAAVSAPNIKVLPRPNVGNEIPNILAIVFSVIGAISLLIIVLAGFQFITSEGDPQKVSNARSAITYAAAGLAVSILAISIVGFVIGHL